MKYLFLASCSACIIFVLALLYTPGRARLRCMIGGMNTLHKGPRPTSEPYLSGDTFRKYCDHIFDIIEQQFDPLKVKLGDVVFVSHREYNHQTCNFIDDYFTHYHPFIKNKYILVTHNSDHNITEEFRHYLESETLFAWFAQNVGFKHPKLIPIPIGLENGFWGREYVGGINDLKANKNNFNKTRLLLMNFDASNNLSERTFVYNLFKDKAFCYTSPVIGGKYQYRRNALQTKHYLSDLCKAKFVLSPHGNGLDCHRTWEALYLGVIPVVKKSTLDPLYEDLPVLIVDDWGEVTREFLEKKYIEMSGKSYKMEKLFIDYWREVFRTYKVLCQASIFAHNVRGASL